MVQALDMVLHAARLKRTPRTGWQVRGAPLGGQAENVAAHSYGVIFLTMLLLDLCDDALKTELALRMAVLHDLAESLVGDIPVTSKRFFPGPVKHQAERAAMEEIVEGLPDRTSYMTLWEAYAEGTTPEARLVKDADRLDMMVQAFLYEQAGQRNLDDFWENVRAEHFWSDPARALYEELRVRRAALWK